MYIWVKVDYFRESLCFACPLQTQNEEDKVSPEDTTRLKEPELKENGIVNPGMETRTNL